MSERILHGGCLCGAVRYAIDAPVTSACHCHCVRCQKFHGAATGPYVNVGRNQFHLLQGAEAVRVYRVRGGGARFFCRTCGSSLFWGPFDEPDAPEFSVALGTFDADPGVRPQYHIHVASRAPWHAITDDLPQFARWPVSQ